MAIEWEHKRWDSTVRQIAKCVCGVVASRLVVVTTSRSYRSDKIGIVASSSVSTARPATCACGRGLGFRAVNGVKTDKKCDARCTEAKGHKCECECAGKNHGASYG